VGARGEVKGHLKDTIWLFVTSEVTKQVIVALREIVNTEAVWALIFTAQAGRQSPLSKL
jgi:hypothetical protein